MNRLIVVVALIAATVGCAPRVTVDRNTRVDFNKYKSFALMDSDVKAGQNPLFYNQIATQNVESSMTDILKQKGLTENTSNPDLLVGYHFFVENKTRTVANPTTPFYGYGPYGGWGRWGFGGWAPAYWGFGGTQYTQENYKDGTLVVDMVDAKTHKLVWRGSVENAVGNPANISTTLAKQAEQIAEQFPNRRS